MHTHTLTHRHAQPPPFTYTLTRTHIHTGTHSTSHEIHTPTYTHAHTRAHTHKHRLHVQMFKQLMFWNLVPENSFLKSWFPFHTIQCVQWVRHLAIHQQTFTFASSWNTLCCQGNRRNRFLFGHWLVFTHDHNPVNCQNLCNRMCKVNLFWLTPLHPPPGNRKRGGATIKRRREKCRRSTSL